MTGGQLTVDTMHMASTELANKVCDRDKIRTRSLVR